MKKPVSHHAAKKHVAAPKENEAALRKRKAVVDARELLLRSAQAETPQPTPRAPEIKVVDVAPDPTTGAAALVPPAPAIAKPAIDQLTSNHPAPRQVDVEALLAAAPPVSSDAVATSVPSPAPAAIPITEEGDEGREWTVSWLGALLLGLGLVSLLGASQSLRGRAADQAISPPEDGVRGHRGRRIPEPSFAFGPNFVQSAGGGRKAL